MGKLKVGDRVEHYRHGLGTVMSVDVTTYSIPMVTVKLDGESMKLYCSAGDFKKVEK